MLSGVRERHIPRGITCKWNLKYDTNEPIYEMEIDSQTWRADLWLPRGTGWGGPIGSLGLARGKLCVLNG